MLTPHTHTEDTISWHNNQIYAWEAELRANEEAKVIAKHKAASKNYSFDSGSGGITSSHTSSDNVQNTVSFDLTITKIKNRNLDVKGVAKLRTAVIKKTRTGKGTLSGFVDYNEKKTVSYTLNDNNVYNYFTVDVHEDPEDGFGPIFITKAGQSSCPYEGASYTKYYEKGTKINEATQKLYSPSIEANKRFITEQPAGRAVPVTLYLRNNSESKMPLFHNLRMGQNSNPNGAVVLLDGAPLTEDGSPHTFSITAGDIMQKTITIAQANTDVLDYNDLEFILYSSCGSAIGYDLADTVKVSVQFIQSCSDIELNIDNRTVNTVSGDSLYVEFSNYNLDYKNFYSLELQYQGPGDIDWRRAKEFVLDADDLTANNELLKGGKTAFYLPMKEFSDGNYQFRAATYCTNGSDKICFSTEPINIVKDMTPPVSMGSPNPSDGILTPSKELSILFNEDIQKDKITYSNFEIKGLLNGYEVNNNVALDFSGVGSAYTEMNLTANNSFSIECWFRRTPGQAGSLFSWGSQDRYISLGFTADNKLKVVNEADSIFSDDYNTDTDWQYVSMTFDRDDMLVSVYVNNAQYNKAVIAEKKFKAPISGRLYLGKSNSAPLFNGQIRQAHFWNTKRVLSDTGDMNTSKTGKENNLIGYWSLDEGLGDIAYDKARSRHLYVNTDWYINPAGKAFVFNGSNYLKVPSEVHPIADDADYTIEFWFKGDKKERATIFSIGHGINDSYPDDKISIGTNFDGSLFLRNSGLDRNIVNFDVLDGQWHHLALSMRRNGSVNIYLDGAYTSQLKASLFTRLAAANIYLGACHYTNYSLVDVTTEYFTGEIDELRLWDAALTAEQLDLNRNHKLSGEESGLMLYYPFETYKLDEGNQLQLEASLNNQVVEYSDEEAIASTELFSNHGPAIKDVRPIEDVAFSITPSDNKVILTITEPIKRIENSILEITSKNVMDVNGNRLVSPVKWTAYINMNRLQWSEDVISVEKTLYEPKNIKVNISNTSGMNEYYTIDNLPVWLSCGETTGILGPQESKEISLVVNDALPIGSYESSITLVGNNDYQETLLINLSVLGEKPDWDVNPNDYPTSMTVTAQLKIKNIYQEDENDIIAAFVNGECRGIASPKYIKALNSYYILMDIYGGDSSQNNIANDYSQEITFQVWDASTGHTYVDVTSNTKIVYEALTFKGSLISPVILNARNSIEQNIGLNKGWSWISFNVESNNIFDQVLTQIAPYGEIIKDSKSYVQSPTWTGGLDTITNNTMYRVKTKEASNLKVIGIPVEPADISLALVKDWNWIPYLPSIALPVNMALSGIEAKTGDQIRSHTNYSLYIEGIGWLGSLTYMMPGQGYLYYNTVAKNTLVYPSIINEELRSLVDLRNEQAYSPHWIVDYRGFQTNMTVTASLSINDKLIENNNYEVGVFVGTECRGTALLQYEEAIDKYLLYLMAFGTTGEKMSFRLYDHELEKEIEIKDLSFTFHSDLILGNPGTPYPLALQTPDYNSIEDINATLYVYPNPVKDYLYIINRGQLIDRYEITDITGKVVMKDDAVVSNMINVTTLPEGVYFVNLLVNNKSQMFKVIKE
ncbi:hypothetical protein M2138_000348 [Dysgonomonadaceae bacterium PH5-43]|nr:hypothetical protein [Dysgonomonadaceae bacterium PH5-43]